MCQGILLACKTVEEQFARSQSAQEKEKALTHGGGILIECQKATESGQSRNR